MKVKMKDSLIRSWIPGIKWYLVFLALVLAMLGSSAQTIWALEAGIYIVKVNPSYKDPDTGNIEDPGNNEAIGQGMTERMCGSTGLLEMGTNGEVYLTVRHYLSQFIKDVSFDERIGGAYSSLSYQEMQTKAPVDGAVDIADKYGYTDYRFKISSQDSVFRGKAYIDAMGRSVVYFFTCSDPMPGSGDFVTSRMVAAEPETASAVSGEQIVQETAAADASELKPASAAMQETTDLIKEEAINGSGDAAAPVTGIPQKPAAEASGGTRLGQFGESHGSTPLADRMPGEKTASAAAEGYYLETVYNLTDVPIKDARKLVEPLLLEAVGITGLVQNAEHQQTAASVGSGGLNGNKMVMKLLLVVAAVLIAGFGAGTVRRQWRLAVHRPEYQQNVEFESLEFQEAAARLDLQYREAKARLRQEFQKKVQGEGDNHED